MPIIIHIRRHKALFLGLLFAFMTLFFVTFAALGLWAGARGALPYWLAFGGTVMFGALALFFLGVAHRRPVALRMDAQGISGFYTAPAEWSEITKIGVMNGAKGHKFLGFTLKDPVGFRDRQSAVQRVTSWINGATDGYHISIPDVLLKDVDIDALAQQAQAFHAAATTPVPTISTRL